MIKRCLVTAVAAFAAVGLAPALAQAETVLTFNFYLPKASPFWKGMYGPFVKQVEEESAGRIKIVTPAATLAPPERQWEMIESGVADIAHTVNALQRQRIKLMQIAGLPFTARTAEAGSIALWRTYKRYFEAANEYKGVKLLMAWVIGDDDFQSRETAITTIADLKGMKLRVNPGQQTDTAKALDAIPVTAPVTKFFEMIAGGVVDATVNAPSSAVTMGFARYIKHNTYFDIGYARTGFSLLMNEDSWRKLAAEDRKVIESKIYEPMAANAGRVFDANQKFGRSALAKQGTVLHRASPELTAEFRKRLAFLEDDWLEDAKSRGVDGPAALAYFKRTAEEVYQASKK